MNKRTSLRDSETRKRAQRATSSSGESGEDSADGYQYDVFISYRRDPAFDVWMTTVVAILGSELKGYLGRDALLFFDVREIKTGDAWGDDLMLALQTSKCLVPFVSLDYFGSSWCRAEFETFRLRPGKLIAPVAVHAAGGRLKHRPELSNIQYLDVQKYHQSSPAFWQNPTLAPEFESLLRSRASDIFALIERAPPFRSDFALVRPDADALASAPRVSTRRKAVKRSRVKTGAAVARSSSGKLPMVFLNTPYDERYRPILEVVVFTVISCGFIPRSVLEFSDEQNVARLDQVLKVMRESQFSIHDLASGTRGNVLLETGMSLAIARLTPCKPKLLIMDDEPHAYRRFLSDLSGLDIYFHKGDQQAAGAHVRNWLAANNRTTVFSAAKIWKDYRSFRDALPTFAKALNLAPGRIVFHDLVQLIYSWQRRQGS